MRISVLHETTYRYERPAKGLTQLLRLTPRPHDGQHIRSWRIEPSVDGRLRPNQDGLGNLVHVYSADGPVEELVVRVTGEVETTDTAGVIRASVERAPLAYFLRETDLTAPGEAIAAFADEAAPAPGADPLATLHALLSAVHESLAFDPDPSQTARSAAVAFAAGKAAGKDIAHVFIAAARHRGIPARYVAGYMLKPDQETQDFGHAWAECHVPGLGWVGFDPVNCLCTTDAHVRVAIGLDSLGAAPVRGARYGGGEESLSVRLRITPAPPAHRRPIPAFGAPLSGARPAAGDQSEGQGLVQSQE